MSKNKDKKSLYDFTPENDIKYKGVISYRHLKIMGWFCLAMTVINIFLGAGMSLSKSVHDKYHTLSNIFSFFAEFTIFFFLFANLAVIIDKKSSYKTLFIIHGGLSATFVLLFVIIYYRYIYGVVKSFNDAEGKITRSSKILNGDFVTFNVFLDLLLCTMVMFFLDYKPKRIFVGKKLIIFRLFVIIPFVYEIGCFIVKYNATVNGWQLHPMVSPFLTTKPLVLFLLFTRMAFYMKNRERRFRKRGKTHEEYEAFLKTNANSYQFAKKFALMVFLYALLDIILLFVVFFVRLDQLGLSETFNQLDSAAKSEITNEILLEAQNYGIGGAAMMILFSPFILMFSYTKRYKKVLYDIMIPVVGFIVLFIIVLEGVYQVLCMLPGIMLG